MSNLAVKDTPEFRELCALAESTAASAHAPARSITRSTASTSNAPLSADEILFTIERSGLAAVPRDAINRLPLSEIPLLGETLFDLYDHCRALQSDAGTDRNLWFCPSPLVQSAIPVTAPDQGATQYHSINGDTELTLSIPIEKGQGDKRAGLPYGIPGRLTLAYLTTECIRLPEGRLELTGIKKTLVEKVFGRVATKGERGALRRYPDSIESWAKTTIQISRNASLTVSAEDDNEDVDMVRYKQIPIASDAFLWSTQGFNRKSGGWLQFSPEFQRFASEHAVPIDYDVLNQVADLDSPHAYDLYYWCVWRLDALERADKPLARITWEQIHHQLLSQCSTTADAIREVMDAIEQLRTQAGITLPLKADRRKGLILHRTPEPIKGSVPRLA